MRARMTAATLAAAALASVAGCTGSGGNGPSATDTQSSAPPTTAAPTSSGTSAPTTATVSSSGGTSSKPKPPPSSSPSSPAALTAQVYLLQPGDFGAGYKTTTQVDATIPSLCGGTPADTLKPYRTTAQIGFFDNTHRLLITEKITTYADETTASQVNSMLLSFDGCGSTAKYNGKKATYSAQRDLSSDVMAQLDSGGAADVTTAQAKVVFVAERRGSTLAQLTFVSIGGPAPSKELVDEVTLKAARRMK